jgi:hypothetical protein
MSGASPWQAGMVPGTTSNADPTAPGVAGSSGVAWGLGTGQHGVTLGGEAGEGETGNPLLDLWAWINTPLTTPLSPWSLGLAVGVVLVAILAWTFILYHIRIAAEAI